MAERFADPTQAADDVAPVWNLQDMFPGGPDGDTFQGEERRLHLLMDALKQLLDDADVPDGREIPVRFDELLSRTCDVLALERVLSLYLAGGCWARTDDTDASARYARFQHAVVTLPILVERFGQWTARQSEAGLLTASRPAEAHARWIRRCVVLRAHRQSTPDNECDLERSATGRQAWQRLYEELAGTVTVQLDGAPVSLNQANQRVTSPDAGRRGAAQASISASWAALAVPAAACMNAIKGDELRVTRATGWETPLARSWFTHDVDRGVFEAMRHAAREARAVLHRFACIKATALGVQQLAWSDMAAPLPGEPAISWREGVHLILEGFGRYHPALARHTTMVLERGWVHAAPTKAKRTTALCLPFAGGASRIMMTFDGSLGSLLSLAHELGHSYHYQLLADCTELQQVSPTTMLEVPSMLCERLMDPQSVALSDESGSARESLKSPRSADTHLHNSLLTASLRIMVGTHARFVFEQDVLARRAHGPLSPPHLRALMTSALRDACGDSIDLDTVPAEMWISHPHLYTSTLHSWSYTFAHLFSLALCAPGHGPQIDPTVLDRLLACTGTRSPAELARTIGADLEDEAFWQRGVDVLSAQVADFGRLVAGPPPAQGPKQSPSRGTSGSGQSLASDSERRQTTSDREDFSDLPPDLGASPVPVSDLG